MTFNYDKLRERAREKCVSDASLARMLNISSYILASKLENNLQFTHKEISKAVHVLGISDDEIYKYFFAEEFRNVELGEEICCGLVAEKIADL